MVIIRDNCNLDKMADQQAPDLKATVHIHPKTLPRIPSQRGPSQAPRIPSLVHYQ